MRRLALLLALALPAATPPGPADHGSPALAGDAEARWVSFTDTPGGQLRFVAEVDGRPADAILDTGVSLSVLSRGFAGLDPSRVRPGGRAQAIGGTVALGWTPTAAVRVGALARRGGGLLVAALPAAAAGSERPVDLLVGRDLLEGHALDIDFAARRFRLLPSGRLPFAGATAPLRVAPTRRVYETELGLGGRTLRPVVVDLGDGSALTLARAQWRGGGRVTTALSFGLAGPVVDELTVAPEVRLGGVAVRGVEVRIEGANGFSQAVGAAGRIGAGLLRRYRVLLDPGAGRMVLAPGPDADRPPVRSTSGLLLGVLPDRLRVLHVMRGGPGAAGGWRAGEAICAVDGAAIDAGYPSRPEAGWTAGTPGRTVVLRTCAGHERRLTLASFY